jgi:hypothetical protein
MQCKWDALRLNIFGCYLLEMVLNEELDESFGNVLDWKEMREIAEEVNTTKPSVIYDENSRWILNGCYTSLQHIYSY